MNKTITPRYLLTSSGKSKKIPIIGKRKCKQGHFECFHEFKERIDEIIWLQKKHHNILDSTHTLDRDGFELLIFSA